VPSTTSTPTAPPPTELARLQLDPDPIVASAATKSPARPCAHYSVHDVDVQSANAHGHWRMI